MQDMVVMANIKLGIHFLMDLTSEQQQKKRFSNTLARAHKKSWNEELCILYPLTNKTSVVM